jgi:Pre-mRNA splicing factor PRP21 like protein
VVFCAADAPVLQLGVLSRHAVLPLGRHDFVVVETIDFYEDEEAELPPPMSLRDVQVWRHRKHEKTLKANV